MEVLIDRPKIGAIAPWFGCNRMLSHLIGEELRGCSWIGIGFAGGMPELLHIDANTIVVNDVHLHVINLALVIQDKGLRERLYQELMKEPFHPLALKKAQDFCSNVELKAIHILNDAPHYEAAKNYFVAVWMNRSAMAGTDKEFTGTLPIRWTGDGGDSNTRYRSAVESLEAWGRVFVKCNFTVDDIFTFLGKVKDVKENGLYLDPPFPEAGDGYKHKFSVDDHKLLAAWLTRYVNVRIVCRFYDHPLIRQLYKASDGWVWKHLIGRKQSNADAPEVILRRN